jgi:DnaJ-domain-containing protein 1
MQDELEEINQRLLDVLDDVQRLFTVRADAMFKSALDPVVQGVLTGIGIDLSQLRGMASGQTAIDPYRVLGLDRGASDEEVKKRYRELAHALHPDKSGTPATGRFFQMVQVAYEVIRVERGWS